MGIGIGKGEICFCCTKIRGEEEFKFNKSDPIKNLEIKEKIEKKEEITENIENSKTSQNEQDVMKNAIENKTAFVTNNNSINSINNNEFNAIKNNLKIDYAPSTIIKISSNSNTNIGKSGGLVGSSNSFGFKSNDNINNFKEKSSNKKSYKINLNPNPVNDIPENNEEIENNGDENDINNI